MKLAQRDIGGVNLQSYPVAEGPTTDENARQQSLEPALENSELRFRQIVEASPCAMMMIRTNGQIEMVNARAELVFGYARTELLGQLVEMLLPERFRKHPPSLRTTFFSEPQSWPMGAGRDLYGLRKDGSEFPVEIGLNPIETKEGTMVLSAIVDISDRKHKEDRVQVALKEKDISLGEIHHRVKNNFQVIHNLLDLQSSKIDNEAALGLLRESQNRIRSMALIHQTIYESRDFARVDFRNFLDTLVPVLVSSYSVDPGWVGISINTADVSLPIDAAIPCGLIVIELISNALKHAFPNNRHGQVKIDVAREPNQAVLLTVSDDGVGIPDKLDMADTTTLGLQLVTLLAEQLGAEVTMCRANPTRFSFRFRVGL